MIEEKFKTIKNRKAEITKRYGSTPSVYSSGIGVNSEKENLPKIRINLDPKIIGMMDIEKEE